MSVDLSRVDQAQAAVLDFVFHADNPALNPHQVSSLVEVLKGLDEGTVGNALGSVGTNLRKFVSIVDSSHPDLATFRSGMFLDNPIATRFCQILEAWKHATKENWDQVVPLYRKMARHNLPSSFLNLRSPEENHQFVRLVKDPFLRQKIRAAKQPRVINLCPFYKKGEIAWHVQPDSFDLFMPGSKAYEAQIVEARKKEERYKALGCESMTKAVSDSIGEFVRSFEQHNYFGFYRLSMTNAAIILAKMHGYTLSSPVRNNDARMVCVPDQFRPFFNTQNGNGKASSEQDAERVLIAELERMVLAVASREVEKKDSKKISIMPTVGLMYAPTVYPLPLFLEYVYGVKDTPPVQAYQRKDSLESYGVWELIQHLEAFPGFNGKPMFDHFLVLVPTPYPFHWEAKCTMKDKGVTHDVIYGGETKTFASALEAKVFLDTQLVKEKMVTPILLGERDGQCYFLSFWR